MIAIRKGDKMDCENINVFKRIMVIEFDDGAKLEYSYKGPSKKQYYNEIAFLNKIGTPYKTYDKIVLKSYKIA